jgi:hypothetical protein
MNHRPSAHVEFADANWPQSEPKKAQALFKDELEAADDPSGLAFEKNVSPELFQGVTKRFGKEDEADSMVSGHSMSRLQKKANLETVWQKANSINGIRKMNMMFKEERRSITALDEDEHIREEYWQVCETFI